MDEYIISPALIVPRGKQFLVFGGEDLIATCPTIEEANFWVETWGQHQIEFRKLLKKTFYKHVDTGSRICPMYIEDGAIGTTGGKDAYWRCREIDHEGNIDYPTYSEEEISEYFTAITFPKAGE